MKYPKIFSFMLVFIFGLVLFSDKNSSFFTEFIPSLGMFGYFVMGFFYVYSFTSGGATMMLINSVQSSNFYVLLAASCIGAFMADFLLILFVQNFFEDEISKLSKSKFIAKLKKMLSKLARNDEKIIITILGFILIASPLPTEAGVALISSAKSFGMKKFLILVALLHCIGIFLILSSAIII